MVHVAGGYSAAVAVPGLLCCDILKNWRQMFRDFVTFTYDVIFLFSMIFNLLVKVLKISVRYVACVETCLCLI